MANPVYECMETEVINKQKEEPLTFEDICPTYDHWISNWPRLTHEQKDRIYNLVQNDAQYCIMGEAHRFDENLGWGDCDVCSEFGTVAGKYSLPDCMIQDKMGRIRINWNLFEQRKNLLVDHWNKAHKK